ncbi:substrate-binding domain-containing protein [Photobacterium angustum]|uniref:Tungsten ABC transporter substrate-binding protein n=1 Tax=Photobacterium angustum TaxID=661 RepID=A0A855SHQ5_PHOAN|nr:substrate-binding domain-containing protein [Photobacterium angustum]KJF80951.1 tungsten ABC transporter substrate-binding protein [Photobacterium damselae subsp. damselae]KJG38812.1 tungsten ABC transporter substrate-binding protein [Photobacterium angustum]KJG44418.1 tungsten ABC transporter substrate-binding protein [Photobacterium angustum]KJG50443.1 tungsten ABC transporter substrate-binding protein [Photobacterium angustum]KJG54315.1 tungsten ABC transporter substrate-binding protein 
MNFFKTSLVVLSLAAASLSHAATDNQENKTIRLATTTSTYHSGLLDYLLPAFKKDTGYTVEVLAAGTGKALRMGENGDVDLVMTHAPKAETKFVDGGFGILPRKLMHNDFVLVGPKADPAKIKGDKDVANALVNIAETNSVFVSRGDDSGTNKKELNLWAQTKMEPNFGGYKAVGQGMGPTLNMASELQAYTLTDRGTWLAYQNKLHLEIMVQGDKRLFNPYQVILVNPSRYPDINYQGAKTFSDWLVNSKAQTMINGYQRHGEQLFVADAITQ